MKIERALDHCALEVRQHDYDRFLCAMFAKAAARNRLFALYALNLELARIVESVSEPALGEIRLQWWRDAVDEAYQDDPRDHPVAVALAATGAAHVASRRTIENLIDARARDLDDTPFPDRGALADYAEGTSSTLLNLALDMMEVSDAGTRGATIPLGRAWALAGIIRATGYLAATGRCVLPADLMSRFGLTRNEVLGGTDNKALRSVISEVAFWAKQELTAACAERTPRDALPVMLMATLTRAYLSRIRRAASNPYDAQLNMSPLTRQITLLMRAARNRP